MKARLPRTRHDRHRLQHSWLPGLQRQVPRFQRQPGGGGDDPGVGGPHLPTSRPSSTPGRACGSISSTRQPGHQRDRTGGRRGDARHGGAAVGGDVPAVDQHEPPGVGAQRGEHLGRRGAVDDAQADERLALRQEGAGDAHLPPLGGRGDAAARRRQLHERDGSGGLGRVDGLLLGVALGLAPELPRREQRVAGHGESDDGDGEGHPAGTQQESHVPTVCRCRVRFSLRARRRTRASAMVAGLCRLLSDRGSRGAVQGAEHVEQLRGHRRRRRDRPRAGDAGAGRRAWRPACDSTRCCSSPAATAPRSWWCVAGSTGTVGAADYFHHRAALAEVVARRTRLAANASSTR